MSIAVSSAPKATPAAYTWKEFMAQYGEGGSLYPVVKARKRHGLCSCCGAMYYEGIDLAGRPGNKEYQLNQGVHKYTGNSRMIYGSRGLTLEELKKVAYSEKFTELAFVDGIELNDPDSGVFSISWVNK